MWQPAETDEIKNWHTPHLLQLFNKMMPSYGSLHMSVWPLLLYKIRKYIWRQQRLTCKMESTPASGLRKSVAFVNFMI